MGERTSAFRSGFWTTVGVVAAVWLIGFLITKR
jgi:ElaB/YqjD/DUF883 family membrane-anchored ribosome-binding protein